MTFDNPTCLTFQGEGALLIWLEQAIHFWMSGQDGDGSFDHLYPLEKSWMAAAFTLVDMSAAWDLTAAVLSPGLRQRWLAAMKKAGRCLVERDEDHGFISNHRAGAAPGLLRHISLRPDIAAWATCVRPGAVKCLCRRLVAMS